VFAIAASLRREAAALGRDPGTYTFTLVSAEPGAELNRRAQAAVDRALERHRILVEPGEAVSVEPGWLTLAGGARIAADAVLVSTQAAPHPALVRSKWPLDSRGFLALRPTLQAVDDDDVFAAGDCATVLAHPRSKAGVFAVRQGPVLADNLRRRLRNKPPRAFSPQKRHLVLLSTADGRAIGARGRWAIEGGWVWWLKNRIDRAFMRRFR
jgi:NADH dehydrogenase FAD-containing subunit